MNASYDLFGALCKDGLYSMTTNDVQAWLDKHHPGWVIVNAAGSAMIFNGEGALWAVIERDFSPVRVRFVGFTQTRELKYEK